MRCPATRGMLAVALAVAPRPVLAQASNPRHALELQGERTTTARHEVDEDSLGPAGIALLPAPLRLPATWVPGSVTSTAPLAGVARSAALPTPSSDEDAVYLSPVAAALAVPLESLGLVALVTYTGFRDWKWGTASFRFNSEGWFSMETGSGGMDKVGHAYGAYMASECLYWRLRVSQDNRRVVSVYPGIFGTLLYLYIETFDGYSVDHGFAYEDVIMNTSGVMLSLLRNTFPVVRRTFDYRLEYFPSRGFDFHPVIDYEGQKFMGVFKFAGVPGLERSPVRFLELLLGYYTRGFENDLYPRFRKANVFLGVGVSLEQLLFKPLEHRYGYPFDFMALATNYFQLPGTYAYQERTRTRLNH